MKHIPAQRCMRLLPASVKLLLLLKRPASLTNCMLHRSMLLTLMDRARGLLTGATAFLQRHKQEQEHKGLQLLLHHTPGQHHQSVPSCATENTCTQCTHCKQLPMPTDGYN
jgi:hypothetical protein